MLDAFFGGLYDGVGAGFIEIRPLLDSSDPRYGTQEGRAAESNARRWFTWPKESQSCVQHCLDLSGKAHVYYGVGLRKSRGGKKDDVGCVTTLWADVDFKDVPRDEALKKIKFFPIPPSACVRSGGGVHVYWFLVYPAFESSFGVVESINRGILESLGAQAGTHNADRILRVPDTLNIKDRYGNPKPKCEISYWQPQRRYPLDTFFFIRPKEKDLFVAEGKKEPRAMPVLTGNPHGIAKCARLMVPVWVPGNRHYMALHVGGWCAHAGLSLETASSFVEAICTLAADEEMPNRLLAVADSYRKYVAGDAVSGRRLFYDFLAKTFPRDVAARAACVTEILESIAPENTERKGCLNSANS